MMQIFRTIESYRKWRRSLPSDRVGFVPTMGFLHEGHLSLIKASCSENEKTVCSIFVNPVQFNNPEDLIHYPRNEKGDLEMLEKAGCDAVFIPSVEEMYPEPVTKTYSFPGIDDVLEGVMRPGHFNGVAVVVSRLFQIAESKNAYFGKKDYQQLMIVRELAKKEFPNLIIHGLPILRESDGLAMSSRNARLSAEERETAPLIYEVLKRSRELSSHFTPAEVCAHCLKMLEASGSIKPEYFTIADAYTLKPATSFEPNQQLVAFVAAWLGKVRLIDNLEYF